MKPKGTKATDQAEPITNILSVHKSMVRVHVLGDTPLICERMSDKAMRQILLPEKKTQSERATTLKHHPMEEFRGTVYRLREAPTAIGIKGAAFKGAMLTASLDLPGATKSQVGRRVWVVGEMVAIYGVPQLYMRPVRMADFAHTPDIRSRAIIPAWACELTIRYTEPLITPQAVLNLLAAGGMIAGVGGYRPEKIKGDFGQFSIVAEDDPMYQAVLASGGAAAQLAALDAPAMYDDETAELYSWWISEVERRRQAGSPAAARVKPNGKEQASETHRTAN